MAAQDDVQKLIAEHQRRLQKLREHQAKQGISTPPEVLTEIEDIEAKIDRLRHELEAEQAKLRQTETNLTDMTKQGLPVNEALNQVQQQLAAIEQHLAKLHALLFDQRGQQVGTQYNVAGDINFGAV